MTSPTAVASRAGELALRLVWRQWSALNPSASSVTESEARWIIDPEALVLVTEALVDAERRLLDMLAWLAERSSGLVSVQRMRTLAKRAAPGDRGGTFASLAAEAGDRRWKSLAGDPLQQEPRPGKGPSVPRVQGVAALMFRLRAGFGVGVKADGLTYLLCLAGEARSAPEIAGAIGYTHKTSRLALRDLSLSGLIEEIDTRPATYAVRPGAAPAFLRLLYDRVVEVPDWVHWERIFRVLLEVAAWDRDPATRESRYIASSRARELARAHEPALRDLGLRIPASGEHSGEKYLPAFADLIEQLEDRLANGRAF